MVNWARALIVVVAWIAITALSAIYLWLGGVNIWTNLMVLLLLGIAIILTYSVLTAFPGEAVDKRIVNEIKSMKNDIEELKKKFDELKKALEE